MTSTPFAKKIMSGIMSELILTSRRQRTSLLPIALLLLALSSSLSANPWHSGRAANGTLSRPLRGINMLTETTDDWKRHLKGCEQYFDGFGVSDVDNWTVKVAASAKVTIFHPFLSTAEGLVPNVTYTVAFELPLGSKDPEEAAAILAPDLPSEFVQLSGRLRRCGLNNNSVVLNWHGEVSQPSVGWIPRDPGSGHNVSAQLVVMYPGDGSWIGERVEFRLRRDCVELLQTDYAVLQSTDLEKAHPNCTRIMIIVEALMQSMPHIQFQDVRAPASEFPLLEVQTESEAEGMDTVASVGNGSWTKFSGQDRWLILTHHPCQACYFSAVVYTLGYREGCNTTLTLLRGEWRSSDHPPSYPTGTLCTITLEAPPGHRVLLRIPFLELPSQSKTQCDRDSLVVGPLASRTGESTGVLCGSKRNLTFFSSTERLQVVFRSDVLLEAEGWTMMYEMIKLCSNETFVAPSDQICRLPGRTSSLQFFSPNDCYFSIYAPLGYQIALDFKVLQVSASQPSLVCPKSYVEVSTGSTVSRLCGNWTGTDDVMSYRSLENVMKVGVHIEPKWSADGLEDTSGNVGFCTTYRTTLVNASLADGCRLGWVSWGLYCYRVFNESLSWAEANGVCRAQGGHLVSVTSQDIQDLLDKILFSSPEYEKHHSFWIGGNDLQYENCFTWADGQDFTYTHWFPGWSIHGGYGAQPSDDGMAQQDCVEARDLFLFPSKGQGHTSSFFWNDRHCDVNSPFVCQHLKPGVTLKTSRKIECNRTLSLNVNNPRTVVTSPGYPAVYPNNNRCVVDVGVPEDFRVEIRFVELHLEDHPSCEYDYVRIEEPEDTIQNERLCGDWTGRVKLLRYFSRGRRLRLIFSSDFSHAFKGFKAEVLLKRASPPPSSQQCDARQFERFGEHCYLVASYPEVSWGTAQRVCSESQATLAAVRTAAQESFLRGLVAALASSNGITSTGFWYWVGGRKSALHLTDGGSWVDEDTTETNSLPDANGLQDLHSVGELPGSVAKNVLCLALQWRPHNNASELQWAWKPCEHSGRYICQKSAFTLPAVMNKTLKGREGTLTSLNFPGHYPSDLHYTVSVVGAPASRLFLRFSRIDLEWQADCLYDYLELRSPHGAASPVRICGQHELDLDKFDYLSESSELQLTFHSDYSVAGAGFSATWRVVDAAGSCGGSLTTLTALTTKPQWITSPLFPSAYPNNLRCKYVLKSESPEIPVLLTVVEFDVGLQDGKGNLGVLYCVDDLLNVTLGSSSGKARVVTLCGENQSLPSGFQLLSYGDTLELSFYSTARRAKRHRGFNVTYQAWNQTSLETVLHLAGRIRGSIRSLNYPHRPPQGLSYSTRLVAPLGQQIELRFMNQTSQGRSRKKVAPQALLTVRDPYERPERAVQISTGPTALDAVNVTTTSTLHVLRLSYVAAAGPFEASYMTRKDASFLKKTTSDLLDLSLDSCYPNPCLNGAACIEVTDKEKLFCDCLPPSAGLFCHVSLCQVGEPCNRHGNCSVSSVGALLCTCQPGFFGSDCSLRTSPCEGTPCGSNGRCVAVNGTFVCHCNIFFEGSRCEKQVFRIPYRPLSQRMLEEPFWLGLITVSAVLLLILLVYCIKRKFADKIEKFLAEEIERSKNNPSPPATRYGLSSTRPSLTPAGLSPQPCQRSLLSRIRRHSVRSAQGGSSPSDKEQGTCAFSFDDLLKRSSQSSGSKKHSANSSDSDNPPSAAVCAAPPLPKEKDSETSRILASLVTSTKSPGKRRMSLDEFIKLSERKIHSIKREETPGDISDVSVASEGSVETSFIQGLTAGEFHSIKEQSFEQNSSSDSLSAGPKTSEVQVEVTPVPESPSKTSVKEAGCADGENATGEDGGCAEAAIGSASGMKPASPQTVLDRQSSSTEESIQCIETPPQSTSSVPQSNASLEGPLAVPKVEPLQSPKPINENAKGAFLDLLQKTMLAASPGAFPKSTAKQETTQVTTMLTLPKAGTTSKQKTADLSVPRKYSVELPMPKILITANMSSCESEEAPSPPRTPNPGTKTMNYLSPLTIMCSSADRTISESNLSTSGYSSLSSPGLSRCNSSSPIADELENTTQHVRRKEHHSSPQKCHSLSPNYQAGKTFQFPVSQAYPCLEGHRPTSPLLQKRRSSLGGALCPTTLKERVGLKGKYRAAASRHSYQTTSTEDSVDDEGMGIDIAEIKCGKSCIRSGGSVDIILDTGKFDIPERDISRAASPFSKSMSLESPRCPSRKADKYRKADKHRRLTPGNSPGLSPSAESLPAELGSSSMELKLSRNPSKASMVSATHDPSSSDTDDAEVRPQRRPCKKPDSRSSGKGSTGGDSRSVSPLFVCRSSSSSDSLPSTNDDVVGTDCSSTDYGPDSRPSYSDLAIVIEPGPRQGGRYGAQTIELYPCLPNPRLRVHPPSPAPQPEKREESTNTPRFFPGSRNVPALKLISPEGGTFRSLDSSGESCGRDRSPRHARRYSLNPASGSQNLLSAKEGVIRRAPSPVPSQNQMLRRQEALMEDDGSDDSVSETTILLPRAQQDPSRGTLKSAGGEAQVEHDATDSLYESSADAV